MAAAERVGAVGWDEIGGTTIRKLIFLMLLAFFAVRPLDGRVEATADYGVFIGVEEAEILDVSAGYRTIVVDGLSFSAETIQALKARGQFVYSYISVGALEIYRDYFERFKALTLAPYENWPDEYWVDVSDPAWEAFVVDELAKSLVEKSVDGFFLDNFDVYALYPEEKMAQGLIQILTGLKVYDLPILINGGDGFVERLIDKGEGGLISGVNQEGVFSRIEDYERDLFGAQPLADRAYFTDYLDKVRRAGLAVYLLEYTTDPALIREIQRYCRDNGFGVYISSSVALDGREAR